MKQFRFPMEVLYRLRKEEERQALFVVQSLRQKLSALEHLIQTLENERREWIYFYNELGKKQDGQSEILLAEQYLIMLERQQRHKAEEARLVIKDIDKALVEVKKAYQARRQVEHLRETRKEAYDLEIQKMERRDVDEMNALRFVHNGLREDLL